MDASFLTLLRMAHVLYEMALSDHPATTSPPRPITHNLSNTTSTAYSAGRSNTLLLGYLKTPMRLLPYSER